MREEANADSFEGWKVGVAEAAPERLGPEAERRKLEEDELAQRDDETPADPACVRPVEGEEASEEANVLLSIASVGAFSTLSLKHAQFESSSFRQT